MKTFQKCAAQGEAYFLRVADGTVASIKNTLAMHGTDEGGDKHIIAHSETGHHHVMNGNTVELYRPVAADKTSAVDILYLIVKEPTSLDHLRTHDTHESIMFSPGEYKVTLQQEYIPEGYRRVAD